MEDDLAQSSLVETGKQLDSARLPSFDCAVVTFLASLGLIGPGAAYHQSTLVGPNLLLTTKLGTKQKACPTLGIPNAVPNKYEQ